MNIPLHIIATTSTVIRSVLSLLSALCDSIIVFSYYHKPTRRNLFAFINLNAPTCNHQPPLIAIVCKLCHRFRLKFFENGRTENKIEIFPVVILFVCPEYNLFRLRQRRQRLPYVILIASKTIHKRCVQRQYSMKFMEINCLFIISANEKWWNGV